MNRALPLLMLLLLAAALHLRGLGQLPFYTIGEPREALEIWEEIHNGEWVLPCRNGIDLPSKPPLFHWLGGLTALATGEVDEFAARFPSALAATLTLLLVYWFAAKRYGAAAAVYAACMLATNFEWIRAARSARVDMTLTAFLTGAFIAFNFVATAARPRLFALVLFYLSMGLATLAKGPLGFLLPGSVALIYLALRRDLRRLWRMHVVLGGALAIGLPACWYMLAALRGGAAFVHKQVLVENLMTFFGWTSDPGTPPHSFFYVVPAFFTGFAPWSVFTIPLGVQLYRNRRRLDADGGLYPLVWFLAIFLFFMVAAGKRTVYLLPAYPAAALLLGVWWSRLTAGEPAQAPAWVRTVRGVALAATALVLVLAAAVVAEALGWQPLDLLSPFLHHTDRENLPLVHQIIRSHPVAFISWAALLGIIGTSLAATTRRKHWAGAFAALALCVAGTALIANDVLHPELAERRTLKPFLVTVRERIKGGGDLAFYRGFDYGTVFYWRQRIPVVDDDLREISASGRNRHLLLWESEWKRLSPEDQQLLNVVERSTGTGPDGKDHLLLARLRSG